MPIVIKTRREIEMMRRVPSLRRSPPAPHFPVGGPVPGDDLAHLRLRHRRVGLVLEELHGAAVGLIAHDAREDHHAARAGVIDLGRDRVRRQRMIDHAEHVRVRAAAHGWKQRELFVGAEPMIGLNVVVTDGEEGERAIRREDGMTADHRRPRGLNRRPFGYLDLEPLLPGGFPVPGKETDPDSHETA